MQMHPLGSVENKNQRLLHCSSKHQADCLFPEGRAVFVICGDDGIFGEVFDGHGLSACVCDVGGEFVK